MDFINSEEFMKSIFFILLSLCLTTSLLAKAEDATQFLKTMSLF